MKKTVSVSELKAKLSAYLDLVRQGDEALVDRGRPIGRLAPMTGRKQEESRRELLGRAEATLCAWRGAGGRRWTPTAMPPGGTMTHRTRAGQWRALAALLLVGAACAPESNDAGVVQESVTERFREYEDAYEAGDASRLAGFYTDDVWLRGPDAAWRGVRGRAAAEALLAAALASVTVHDVAFAVEDVVPLGNGAFAGGTWSEELTVAGDSSRLRLTGGYAALWRRQPDGAWRIARLIWNVHTPEEAAGGEGGS